MDSGLLKQLNQVGSDTKELRTPYDAHFRELGEFFMPRRSRFSQGKDFKSTERINRKVINPRPRLALRTMQSGIHAGITSPARPWFRLITAEAELRDYAPMKEHLHSAQREMRRILQASGMYTMLHVLWGDLGLFGCDAAIIEDDVDNSLYGQALVSGEYWIAANARGMVDTLYREYRMTVKQVVAKFVYKNDPRGTPDWSAVTDAVKRMWDANRYSEKVPVRHLIMPRTERDPRSKLAHNKPFMSTYWEEGESSKVLGDLGYDQSPILSSRWDAEGTNTYGSSPAMDALPDAKELQRKERDKAEAVRRMNRPPMNAPAEMRNSPFSLMPEAVNFMSDPSKGLVPSYQFNPPVSDLREDIRDSEERIDEAMYANLFLMIASLDRRQITAREIDERHEEKLLGLGPVLERQHKEKLAVLLKRVYATAVDSGNVVPLPPDMQGVKVTVDYTSTLGQAMKAVATGGMERLYGFAGNLAAIDGSVMDNFDNDVAIDEYADMVGVPSNVIRSQDKVDELRQQRAAQVQQQQQADQMSQAAQTAGAGAQAAKVLSEASGQPRSTSGDILRTLGLTR
tara:strand:+ start:8150 stop:9859 length:1710 start_codon:yes stop_codon:yes gene_type:complete